jgi:hypothetical protein
MKILSIIGIVLLCACNKEITTPIQSHHSVSFRIDSVLNTTGTNSLKLDNNGFYHLIIDTSKFQNLARITGKFFVDGKPNTTPSSIEETIEWNSDHFWILNPGDTVAHIVKTYINLFTGQLNLINLKPLIAHQSEIIPIINSISYSDRKNGNVNTMFAPVSAMKGDTITITGKAKYTIEIPNSQLFSDVKIDSIQKSIKIICD